jgi:hypothetical protein
VHPAAVFIAQRSIRDDGKNMTPFNHRQENDIDPRPSYFTVAGLNLR